MTVVINRRKRVLRWLIAIVAALVLVLFIFWKSSLLSKAPDLLAQELVLAERDGIPTTPEDLKVHIGVPPAANAGPLLKQAFSAIKKWKATDEGKAVLKVTGSFQQVGSLKPADIERVGPAVSEQREIFSLLSAAVERPRVDFELNYHRGAATEFPELEQERAGVALLVIRSRYELQEGKQQQAIATLDLAAKVSRLVTQDPSVIGLLIGSSTRNLVCDTVTTFILANPTRQDVLGSARHVLEDLGGIPDLAPALQSEFVMSLITIDQVRSSKLPGDAFGTERKGRMVSLAQFGPIGAVFELRYVQTFRNMYEQVVHSRRSVLQMHKALIKVQIDLDRNSRADWTYTLTELLAPVFEGIPMSLGESEAKRHVLLAAIDLLELRNQKGKAVALTPGSQSYWIDPFTEKPLKIRAQKDGFIVYSVGRDEKDNGGKPRPKNSFYEGYDITFSFPKPTSQN